VRLQPVRGEFFAQLGCLVVVVPVAGAAVDDDCDDGQTALL
jgi:hypothetical protein